MPSHSSECRQDDTSSDSGDEGSIVIMIRSPPGPFNVKLFQAEFETMDVLSFKNLLSPKLNWPPDKIMLVFSGRTMDDANQLTSYGVSDGSKVIASRQLYDRSAHDGDSKPPIIPTPRDDCHSNMFSAGSTPSENTAGPPLYPGFLRSILDNQAIGSALQSPEFIKNLQTRESAINKMLEQNQDLMQLLNDSELLRQVSDTFKSPKLMQEVMRNNDRQLSNVEALPGGLNILSGLYQSLQESTNFGPFDKSTDSLNNEFARILGVKKRQLNEVNQEPLPNPWISKKTPDDKGGGVPPGLFMLKDDLDPLIGLSDPLLSMGKYSNDNDNLPVIPSSFLGMIQILTDMSTPLDDSPKVGSDNNINNSVGVSPHSPPTQKIEEKEIENPHDTPEIASKNTKTQNDSESFQQIEGTTHDEQIPSATSSQKRQTSSDASAEERYAREIRLLMEMGFSKKEDCISALLATGGSVEGAVAYLKCITFPQDNGKN